MPQASACVAGSSWVSALGAVRQCNAAFSGATDGSLQAWQLTRAKETDKELRFVPAAEPVKVPGSINGITVGKSVVVCAVGKEHRLGRWFVNRGAKNGLLTVP